MEIRSATNSSSVTFKADAPLSEDEGIAFVCELQGAGFRGAIRGDTGYRNGPTKFFAELASEWSGWDGEKSWHSECGEVVLRARADRLGHVTLRVTLRTFEDEELSVPISLEAGVLSGLVAEVEQVLG